jgi:hypothetical protein
MTNNMVSNYLTLEEVKIANNLPSIREKLGSITSAQMDVLIENVYPTLVISSSIFEQLLSNLPQVTN